MGFRKILFPAKEMKEREELLTLTLSG